MYVALLSGTIVCNHDVVEREPVINAICFLHFYYSVTLLPVFRG